MRSFVIRLILILTVSNSAFGRQLSAEEALRRLRHHDISTLSVAIRSINSNRLSLVHQAAKGEYFVFDIAGGGYVIASGDDRAEALLAEITDGTFCADSLPPSAKWMLDEYTRQIKWLRSVVPESNRTNSIPDETDDIASLYARWSPISPLMTCLWNQTTPYNQACPEKSGRLCMTGCVATAMAQVIRTIGHAQGSGYKSNASGDHLVEFDYTDYDFKLDIMPDVSSYTTATHEQIKAVGQLMLACGLSVDMNYGSGESGASSEKVPTALKENFGYGDHTTLYNRNNFSTSKWESIIYRELQLKRPVYYTGFDRGIGHAFVVDGYGGHGLWHINWGWGGLSDGYFRLSALSPGQQGIGGTSSGGYNQSQSLVKAVPPGCDPGLTPCNLTGSIGLVSDGVYSVAFRSTNGAVRNATLGAVIVDAARHPMTQVPFWRGQNVPASGSVTMDEYPHDFSLYPLPQGNYRIYPAAATDGSDSLQITESYEGKNYYIDLNVNPDGTYSYSENPTLAGADIHISDIEQSELREFSAPVTFSVVNNGNADFRGTLTIGLTKCDDTEYLTKEMVADVFVAAGYNTTITRNIILWDTQYNDLPPGEYRVLITDSEGNILDSGTHFNIRVLEFSRLGWVAPSHFHIFNIDRAPSVIVTGETWNHEAGIYNDKERDVVIELQFFKPGSTVKIKSYTVFAGTLSKIDGTHPITHPVIDLPFGIYEASYVESGSEISDRVTIRVCDKTGDIYYTPLSESEVAVAPHPQYAYSGDIMLPRDVTFGSTDYTVTSLAPYAFSESPRLTSVVIPASVRQIGVNAFASSESIDHIIMHADTIPFAYRNHVAPGLNGDAIIYVPQSVYEQCHDIMGKSNQTYTLIESVESKSIETDAAKALVTLTVTPLHHATNPEYQVTPLANGLEPAADVALHSVEPGKVTLEVTACHEGTADFHIQSVQPGVIPALLSVTVTNTSVIDLTKPDPEALREVNYDLHGRKLTDTDRGTSRIIITVTPQGLAKRLSGTSIGR